MSRPRYILRHLVHAPGLAAYREVVHLLHAVEPVLRTQRLPPIRRNASLTYLCTVSCGGTSFKAFSASSIEYPKAAKASFGPTLLTVIKESNAARSPLSAKPNRSIASSRTTIRVCSTHSSPIDGSALKV